MSQTPNTYWFWQLIIKFSAETICLHQSLDRSLSNFEYFICRNNRFVSLPLWRVRKHNTRSVSIFNVKGPVLNGSPLRRSYLGTMIDFETSAASDWVPVIDQVLLTATVFFAYMAGIIPSGGSYTDSQKNKNSFNDVLLPENPIFFGR